MAAVKYNLAISKQKNTKNSHKTCAAALCNNRSENRPELIYHNFPSDSETSKKWEVRMRRGDEYFKRVENRYCCSEHFVPSDYRRSLTGHRMDLKKGAIPSVFPWSPAKTNIREERLRLRTGKVSHRQVKKSEESPLCDKKVESGKFIGPPTLEEFAEAKSLEVPKAREKEYVFMFGLERFSKSPDDIHFYTGFPDYETLLEFWKYIEPSASNLTYYSSVRDTTQMNADDIFPYLNTPGKKLPGRNVGAQRNLQPIDEFWLFLTRLRLGLFERDLAFRFNISVSTVSDIMITYSNYLFVMLGSLPVWASKDVIKQHLPTAFQERFENIRCIIDCTEIKCEKPEDLQKQSDFYSEYKSHNTFKGLIGISPNVWVTFVSSLYGGSISDREIVEKSHFVDFLEQGDLIMADRGFDIQDLLATKQAQLFIPPQRQSAADQFSKEDCFETMRIANVRIHVERAIRRVKGWHIFDRVLPLSMAGVVNQVWTVCCLLTNWQEPVLTLCVQQCP